MGKSKLRKPDEPTLGARYGGVAVSRKALEEQDDDEEEEDPFAPVDDEEDYDDPFAAKDGDISNSDDASGSNNMDDGAEIDDDDEIDSDEALGESDVERFKNFTFRGSKANSRGAADDEEEESASQESEEEDELSDDQSLEDSEGSDLDVGMDDDDGDDDEPSGAESESESLASSASSPPPRKPKSNRDLARAELRKAATSTSSTAALASALSASANADVKKGQAVKQQQQTFDRLLDARIKLQKGLAVASELERSTLVVEEQDVKAAAQQAEEAALALWSTIASIRSTFVDAHTNTKSNGDQNLKRKRPSLAAAHETSTSELWKRTTALDATAHTIHRATLDKWNAKTQPIIDTSAPRSKLLQSSSQTQTHSSRLTSVLDTYLATSSTSLIQSSTPNTNNSNNNTLYDDGPFYQSLLRDLITARTAAGTDSTIGDGTYLPPKLHISGSRAKKVDTKASKGRKVRYNVHEKLQDFMAVEDRGTWEDAARTEFFASLFGNRGVLDEVEDEGDGEDGGVGDGVVGKEGVALRLFRN